MELNIDIITSIILFIAGILAGLINVLAGGGTAIPIVVLTVMGVPSTIANAAVRPGMLFAAFSSTWDFFRKREKITFNIMDALRTGLFVIPGGVAGAFFLHWTPDEIFDKILAVVIIIVGLSLFIPMKKSAEVKTQNKILNRILMILVGIYGGFIQAGVGLVQMFVFKFFKKMDMVEMNAHKMVHNIMFSLPALVAFIALGKISGYWLHALIVVLGCTLGGKLAVSASIRVGAIAIKISVAVILLIMLVTLLWKDNIMHFFNPELAGM